MTWKVTCNISIVFVENVYDQVKREWYEMTAQILQGNSTCLEKRHFFRIFSFVGEIGNQFKNKNWTFNVLASCSSISIFEEKQICPCHNEFRSIQFFFSILLFLNSFPFDDFLDDFIIEIFSCDERKLCFLDDPQQKIPTTRRSSPKRLSSKSSRPRRPSSGRPSPRTPKTRPKDCL